VQDALLVAVLLATLLPGAGFVGAAVVVLLGIGVIVWLFMAATRKQTPSDLASRTKDVELLGPRRSRRSRPMASEAPAGASLRTN
jgi:hypothetical protein